MAKKEATLTACMLTQDLLPDHWFVEDDEKAIVSSGDTKAILDMVIARLTKYGAVVVEAYAIIHDKDTVTEWDEINLQEVISYKTHHIHILIKFAQDKGLKLSEIATAVGLEPQFVEKPQRGKFAYDNMLAYLVHIKYEDKHQYEPAEVYTALGESYIQVYHKREEEWLKGRAKIKAQTARVDIDWLEEKILLGEVTKQQVLLTDDYFAIYARNKHRCEEAFDTYGQRKIYRTIQKMENGEFKVSVIFITGQPHAGKSAFTDALVRGIQNDIKAKTGEVWTVATCGANNPFDEYNGEEILVMDDLRGMALTASDWLKLLDPDRINIGSARYHNKRMACRTIIINSEKDVVDFFYFSKGVGGRDADGRAEAMDQFIRRIMARVVVYRLPDDNDVRRLRIGKMEETDPYRVEAPTNNNPNNPTTLTLHHHFNSMGSFDVSLDEGVSYLSALIMRNNKIDDDDINHIIDTYSSEVAVNEEADIHEAYFAYRDEFSEEHPSVEPPTYEWWHENIYMSRLRN